MIELDHSQQSRQAGRADTGVRGRARRVLRALALNGALLGLSLGLSFVLAEAAIRLVAPQQLVIMRPDLWVPRDSLGYWNRSGVRTTVNTGERPALIVTDAEGYRVASSGRVEGDRTVLLLGDSFMKALQVDYEQSLAGRMEESLSRVVGETVAVRNAGVDGWDPNQYLAFARSALARDRIDVVVVALYVGNDVVSERVAMRPPLAPVIRRGFHLPRSLSRGALVDATVRPLNDELEQRSHFYVFAKSRASALLMRLGLTGADFPREIQRDFAASPGWAVTGDICAEIAALAASHGAATVFVLIPSSYQVHREQFITFARGFGLDTTQVDLDQPNRLLGEALRARDLVVVDPLDSLRAAARTGQQLFGSVDRHLSPAGHAVIERTLRPAAAAALVERGGAAAPHRGAPARSVTLSGAGSRSGSPASPSGG